MALIIKSEGKFERFMITGDNSDSKEAWEMVDEMELHVIACVPYHDGFLKYEGKRFRIVAEKELD